MNILTWLTVEEFDMDSVCGIDTFRQIFALSMYLPSSK